MKFTVLLVCVGVNVVLALTVSAISPVNWFAAGWCAYAALSVFLDRNKP